MNNSNVFNQAPPANPEAAQPALLSSSRSGGAGARIREATTIRIDSELPAARAAEQQQQSSSTSINMESSGHASSPSSSNGSGPFIQRNFMTLLNQARTQLGRQSSHPGVSMTTSVGATTPEHRPTQYQFGARVPRENNGFMRISNNSSGSIHNNSSGSSGHNNSDASGTSMSQSPSSPSGGDVPAPHSRRSGGGGGIRSWRMNLNEVLSFSTAPSTEALRSLISNSGGFRYMPLSTNENAANAPGDNIHLLLRDQEEPHESGASSSTSTGFRASAPTLRSNSMREEVASGSGMPHSLSMSSAAEAATAPPATMPFSFSSSALATSMAASSSIAGRAAINDATAPHHHHHPQPAANSNNFNNRNAGVGAPRPANNASAAEQEDDNVIAEMLIRAIGHFVRYLPFIGILFIKFIHDHLLGILDLLLLHGIMYQVNKTLREQIAKFSQKSYAVLLRDFGLVAFVVAYRFVVAGSQPDPFGLLISPPSESITIAVSSITTNAGASVDQAVSPPTSASEVLSQYLSSLTAKPQPSVSSSDPLGNTVTITKAISFGALLYYVAVNDLILKLITILTKITITMMPTKVVRHKSRARMYVLVEHLSQFYRALAPVRQWLIFLFESYSGLEVISGILFSSFYMGAKGFEFFERGKSLKKACIHLVRNMDYERKPTKDELEAAGTICAICHDAYATPVVLECGHIFCDECVNTWFRREQTCPMCRAQVSEDPTWQDGATTFFYQLC